MTQVYCTANRVGRARRRRSWCAASALLLFSTLSVAEPSVAENQRAEELFNDGRTAMAQERFEPACAAFAESQKLEPAAGTLANLGACLEAQGKTASALAAYRASLAHNSGTNAAREVLARDRIAALEPLLCHLTLAIPPDAPAGLVVMLDATELDRSRWNTPEPVDPGSHRVDVSLPGAPAWSKAFNLDTDGAARVIHVPLPATRPPSPPVLQPHASPVLARRASSRSTPQNAASSAHRVRLVVASGVAAAGALGTVYFGLRAASAWEERQTHCPAHGCDDIAVRASSRASSFALAADVSAVVTGAALAAGLYFVFTPPRDSTAPRASVTVLSARDHTELQWKSQF